MWYIVLQNKGVNTQILNDNKFYVGKIGINIAA
jgi:hypothetical protein